VHGSACCFLLVLLQLVAENAFGNSPCRFDRCVILLFFVLVRCLAPDLSFTRLR
jgi:hypothetical protein